MNPSSSHNQKLSDYAFLFFSLTRNDGKYTSSSWQISSALAKTNRVIFIDQPYTFIDAITKFMNSAVRRRIQSYTGDYFFLKDGVEVVLAPFIWPVSLFGKGKLHDFFSAWNNRILAKRINRFLKSSNIDTLIYVNAFNFRYPELPELLTSRIVLNISYCVDLGTHIGLPHNDYPEAPAENTQVIISNTPRLQKNFMARGVE